MRIYDTICHNFFATLISLLKDCCTPLFLHSYSPGIAAKDGFIYLLAGEINNVRQTNVFAFEMENPQEDAHQLDNGLHTGWFLLFMLIINRAMSP